MTVLDVATAWVKSLLESNVIEIINHNIYLTLWSVIF